MSIREIADDFIVAVDWFNATERDVATLRTMLASYPRWSLIIELYPTPADGWVIV